MQYPHQEPGQTGEAIGSGEISGFSIGNQSVVLPDKTKAKALFDAVRKDDTSTIETLGGASK